MESEEKGFKVDGALKEKIAAHVKELRVKNPALKKVFPIVVQGDEYDEKEVYVGYFKQPDMSSFSKYISISPKDQVGALRELGKDCFVDGDKEMLTDSLFLFGTMAQLSSIIQVRNSAIVNLSKPGK